MKRILLAISAFAALFPCVRYKGFDLLVRTAAEYLRIGRLEEDAGDVFKQLFLHQIVDRIAEDVHMLGAVLELGQYLEKVAHREARRLSVEGAEIAADVHYVGRRETDPHDDALRLKTGAVCLVHVERSAADDLRAVL